MDTGKAIEIWTDGACFPNPGPGAWAWVINDKVYCRGMIQEDITTNNRAELWAVIAAIRYHSSHDDLVIYSDSQYVVYTINKSWRRRKNVDLWAVLDEVMQGKKITFNWVKGHGEHELNNLADHHCTKLLKCFHKKVRR